jgi:hypothetical protein
MLSSDNRPSSSDSLQQLVFSHFALST